MPRRPNKPHELKPVRKPNGAYVWYAKRWVYLGKWDAVRDEPGEEARERLEQFRALWRVDPLAGVPTDSKHIFELWLDWLESPEAPRTSQAVIDRTERYLFGTEEDPGPHEGTIADDFDGRALQAWQSHLCGLRDKNGRPLLSRDTVGRSVRLVRALFDWGCVQNLTTVEQAYQLSKVPPPQVGAVRENIKRRPVNRSAVEAILPHLSPPLRAAAAELIWLTCSRPSEILGLRVADVVRAGKVLTPGGIVLDLGSLGVWCAILDEHKTDDTDFERIIFFGPKSQAILGPLLDRSADAYLLDPAEGRRWWAEKMRAAKAKPGGPGSHKKLKGEDGNRKPGEGYPYGALATAVKRACVKLGLPRWTPYQLRHSAFRLVQAEFGRDAARAYGGHKVGGATENYAGTDLKTAANVAGKMG